jgi:hypothetical protein
MKWSKLRFQIHLSTAIVVMFVAGELLWLNIRKLPDVYPLTESFHYRIHGWPFVTNYWLLTLDSEEATLQPPNGYWDWPHLVVNFFCALIILALVAFVCEWWIRHRHVRKPETSS